jgi:cyclopropane fatty-acyl-phospholipid synthase-like methyltransferase
MMTNPFALPEFWDTRYRDQGYVYGLNPNDFLREHATLFKAGDKVLSLAEGEGRNAVFLAQQGCKVCGVDFSAEGRKKALRLAQQHGVEIDYDVADLTQYDMGEAIWDGIVSIFCHLVDRARPAVYRAIKRGLKPSGLFLLESYNKKQLEFDTGGPRDATHLPSLEELQRAFDDFEFVVAQDIKREVREGQCHVGLSSVTQFIARRRN